MNLSIKQISKILSIQPKNPEYFQHITSVKIDSRVCLKDSLFVAVKGENFDGHDFIQESQKKGAVAFFIDETSDFLNFISNPIQFKNIFIVKDTILALHALSKSYLKILKAKCIVITGSVGKTTTKDMLKFVLESNFKVIATKGNLNNHLGLPLTIFEADESTDICIFELGISDFGEMTILAEIVRPDIGVILNIGKSHLEKLKNLEGVLLAKWELAQFCKLLFINDDDSLLARKLNQAQAFVSGKILELEYGKQNIVIDAHSLKLNILGVGGFYAAKASYSVAQKLGMTEGEIIKRIEDFRDISSMRQELVKVGGIQVINDAYNANPTSMLASLDVFEKMVFNGKKVVLLGDMLELGELSKQEHYALGQCLLAKGFDEVILFGLDMFCAYQGMLKQSFWSNDRKEVSKYLKHILADGDRLFLKGSRGMKLEKFINDL
ncbi:MAG: UDP-N-acetylmuramoyl-tripeptide--D-alanyl-D-alanine ligase [bacterium]|nr:UDP-N-acetylmuramoyl-tripeptide--D-alanyl-D-alanine ligase [bacterium]